MPHRNPVLAAGSRGSRSSVERMVFGSSPAHEIMHYCIWLCCGADRSTELC